MALHSRAAAAAGSGLFKSGKSVSGKPKRQYLDTGAVWGFDRGMESTTMGDRNQLEATDVLSTHVESVSGSSRASRGRVDAGMVWGFDAGGSGPAPPGTASS